jgi:DNA-binding LacI/PurR family transcriptional regulator/signal transduction histidine kinase/ActR/RegA family two-component response regulator
VVGGPRSLKRVAGARRRTVAVLSDYMTFFGGGYEGQVRDAFDQKCRELDLNLIMVFGRALDEPNAGSGCHNEIFELMHPERVDGVVILSSSIGSHGGGPSIQRLVARLPAMPIVSFGLALPEIPSLIIDNRGGMRAVIEHLAREHGCRRIAYLRGIPDNAEDQDRLAGYRDVLVEHGIPFDAALVETGNFVSTWGRAAMERLLASGVHFDAVACASDAMALGAIEALRAKNLRVPRDIPVTGFDDLAVARLGNPPLTTVAQPFEEMATTAIELLLGQLSGESTPEVTALPTKFFARRSCGCIHGPRERLRERASERPMSEPVGRDFDSRVKAALAAAFRGIGTSGVEEAERLLRAIAAERAGTPRAFTSTIEEMLDESGGDNESYRALHHAVSYLREELRGVAGSPLDDVLFDALSSVAFANTTAQAQHRLEIDETYHRLLLSSHGVSIAFDLRSLKNAFQRSLAEAGVRTAFVSRWVSETSKELEPFVCLQDGEPVHSSLERYPAHALMPPIAWDEQRRKTFLLFPVSFETQRQGVAAFEYHPGTNGHQVLRDQLSGALMTVGLHQELVQKTMLHERSVQERLATSKRIESLSMLAGGVAHDLNNALGPMVALPDVILSDLSAMGVTLERAEEVYGDIESIRTAAFRAAQTIKDLLTLGRQGRTRKEPFDINRAILTCSFSSMKSAGDGVNLSLELASEPLPLAGSESHVTRAITNLVRNAIEAVAGSGRVVVKTYARTITEPHIGYETVEPGTYAVVEVSDDGQGIPSHELGRVFEPFFSTKRVREQSGSGLGLAIVHGVVKEHDGFIDVVSVPGNGTTFALYFPTSGEPARRADSERAPRGNAKVLFVDDERIQLRTGARVLSHLGYEVHTLESGRSAHELFSRAAVRGAQSPYDLVILDMLLNEPEDGLQVLEHIQRLFPTQKGILASGHAPTQRAERAVAKGVCWVVKPYTQHALANAVETALGVKSL